MAIRLRFVFCILTCLVFYKISFARQEDANNIGTSEYCINFRLLLDKSLEKRSILRPLIYSSGEEKVIRVQDSHQIFQDIPKGGFKGKGLVAIAPGTDMVYGPTTAVPPSYADLLQHELGDPIEYYLRNSEDKVIGVIHTGTGYKMIFSKSMRGFMTGTEPLIVNQLQIFRPSLSNPSKLIQLTGDRLHWDLTFLDFKTSDKTERVAYAGVMTPTREVPDPKISQHNHLREIHVLKEKNGKLIDMGPLMPRKLDPENIWLGHSYGPKFIREDNGKLYILYEKVVEQVTQNGRQIPKRTELFRREMLSATEVSPTEEKVLGVTHPFGDKKNKKPLPSTQRRDGGSLIEGLMVTDNKVRLKGSINAKEFHRDIRIASWSSGDFDGKYGAYLGEWVDGKIKPLFNSDFSDYENVLADISARYNLRGAGRLSFVRDPEGNLMQNNDGTYAVRFHAYLPNKLLRRIIFAKAQLSLDERGRLAVKVIDESNDP